LSALKNFNKKALINLIVILIMVLSLTYYHFRSSFSSQIHLSEGQTHYVNIDLPFVYVRAKMDQEKTEKEKETITLNGKPPCQEYSLISDKLNVEGIKHGKVQLEVSLWGVIPLRNVTINVLPEIKVTPGGQSIGIKVKSDGVIVVDYYEVTENYSPAKEAGIKKGDVILEVEGEPVSSVNHTAKLLKRAAEEGEEGEEDEEEITLKIERNKKEKQVQLKSYYLKEEDTHRVGIYIRDTAAGVGTLSFYHPETGRYGALGHVIMDSDTRKPVDLSRGSIVNASIVNISAARRGYPGEKTGIFMEEEPPLGSIDKNTTYGIFGEIENPDKLSDEHTRSFPVGLASEVEKGEAKILTVIEDQDVETFEAKIKRVSPQEMPRDKSLVIKITDEELLEKTGGIVQGMSGSPIIQNGKIVGAITHVFVNNPRQGYGVFMEWMVQEADLFSES